MASSSPTPDAGSPNGPRSASPWRRRILVASLLIVVGVGAVALGGVGMLFSIPLILGGAVLFTNAVEWLGVRLGLGEGAIGSLLAAVGTALPESIIPILALARGGEGSEEVAIGAIIGAPFVLATVAMAVVGISAFAYKSRRETGLGIDVHVETTRRDLLFFTACLLAALALGVGLPAGARIAGGALLLAAYVAYAVRTIRAGGELMPEGELDPLTFDRSKGDAPSTPLIVVQVLVGLVMIIGGAELFVDAVLEVATSLGLSTLAVALVLTPIITELPEKANSILWVRDGDDALAVGNITGAMVFQSTVPVTLGLVLSDWELERFSYVAGGLAIAGGLLAILALRERRFTLRDVIGWSAMFLAFVIYVVVTG